VGTLVVAGSLRRRKRKWLGSETKEEVFKVGSEKNRTGDSPNNPGQVKEEEKVNNHCGGRGTSCRGSCDRGD